MSSDTTARSLPLLNTSSDGQSRTPTIVDEAEDINKEEEENAYGPAATGKKVDPFEVGWEKDDLENPKNWSRVYRWYITMVGGLLVLNA